jgi:hypothetical protein
MQNIINNFMQDAPFVCWLVMWAGAVFLCMEIIKWADHWRNR